MKTLLLIYIITYISIAQIRADIEPVKTFSCQSSYSMFDPSFQQGDELFVDVYINNDGNVDVRVSQMFGPEYTVLSNKPFSIGESRTNISTKISNGSYLSMVFLGSDNWGLYLKTKEGQKPDFLSTDIEVMCKQVDFSVI